MVMSGNDPRLRACRIDSTDHLPFHQSNDYLWNSLACSAGVLDCGLACFAVECLRHALSADEARGRCVSGPPV